MTTKPEDPPAAIKPPVCGNCSLEECKFIHHVRLRGVYRDLCTNCVLRLHPQSFCPICFQVYPPPPPTDTVLNCTKCYSYSHIHCVASSGTTTPPSPYICPLCINSNTLMFKLKTVEEVNLETGRKYRGTGMVMDTDASKKFVAASKISNSSMNKAGRAAKCEAEKRGKEAAMTKKRARESLEYVSFLLMKDRLMKREAALAGNGNPGLNNRNGIAGNSVGQSVTVEKINTTPPNVDQVNTAPGSRENVKMAVHVDKKGDNEGEDEELFLDIETTPVQENIAVHMENAINGEQRANV